MTFRQQILNKQRNPFRYLKLLYDYYQEEKNRPNGKKYWYRSILLKRQHICPVCAEPYDEGLRWGDDWCKHSNSTGTLWSLQDFNPTSKLGRRIRQDREHFAKDILQPYDRHGRVNEHFKKLYGDPTKVDMRKKGTNFK
jgi:hypothetical protein